MSIASLFLVVSLAAVRQGSSTLDVRSLPDLLDSLQSKIEDFRCEYEGTSHYMYPSLRKLEQLKDDGLYETFSGVFIWKAGGDTVLDAFHRREPTHKIVRETLIVRGEEAEHYLRLENEPLGGAEIDEASFTNADRSGSLGHLFLIDSIKRFLSSENFVASLEDTSFDGRPCTVLTIRLKPTGKLYQRFWIDLKRGGHTFLREGYIVDDRMAWRQKIELSRFPIADTSVWFPAAGLTEAYVTYPDPSKPGAPEFHKTPVNDEKIYVVAGTLEFNLHPPASTFTANYKPGTPVTDHLRQLQYEFGQLKPTRHTRAEAETQLRQQLAVAEAQKSELSASSPARSRDWSTILAWIFAGISLVASVLVLISRRRSGS